MASADAAAIFVAEAVTRICVLAFVEIEAISGMFGTAFDCSHVVSTELFPQSSEVIHGDHFSRWKNKLTHVVCINERMNIPDYCSLPGVCFWMAAVAV